MLRLRRAARRTDGILKARVKLEQGPAEIMISPDLIFTDKDKSKDDDKNAA